MCEISQMIAQLNNIENCQFVPKYTFNLKSTEVAKADVVVCETLGSYAFEENIIENIRDAKKFLKKSSNNKKVVPRFGNFQEKFHALT